MYLILTKLYSGKPAELMENELDCMNERQYQLVQHEEMLRNILVTGVALFRANPCIFHEKTMSFFLTITYSCLKLRDDPSAASIRISCS